MCLKRSITSILFCCCCSWQAKSGGRGLLCMLFSKGTFFHRKPRWWRSNCYSSKKKTSLTPNNFWIFTRWQIADGPLPNSFGPSRWQSCHNYSWGYCEGLKSLWVAHTPSGLISVIILLMFRNVPGCFTFQVCELLLSEKVTIAFHNFKKY